MYYIEYTSNSGKRVPSKHKMFESVDQAEQHGQMTVASGLYRRYNIVEGWSELPPINREKYQTRSGLEGPIQTKSGKTVYYDPKAGMYYDPDTDMYLSYDDWKQLDSPRMHKINMNNESVEALRQIVTDKNSAKVNGTLVDLFTASAIMQVYDAVNDANKEKMDSMLKTKAGLMKIANFAMTKVESATNEGYGSLVSPAAKKAIDARVAANTAALKAKGKNPDGTPKKKGTDEGHSPHKKGTEKYKKHMAAMHAEAEGDWSKDSGWQDYKGQKKDPYGNTIKDKNLAKRMAKAAKKQSAETDIDENQMQTAQEAMVDGEITKDSVKKRALELLVDIAKTSKQYKGEVTDDQVHYLGSLVHDFDMAGIETEKYSEIEKLFRTASKTNKADMSMIQPAYAQAKTLDENQAYRDARLTTIQTDRTNRLNQIQQNRDDRKAELKTSRDSRSVKNRAALDSLKETLSPEEKKLVSKMYNKDGTLTALGKKVMDHGKTNEVTEGVADEAVHMERDHEVQMARSDLYKIANYAVKLHKMLKNVSEEQGIQGWMQAKITMAADYMSSVAHTLEYDMVAETLVSEKLDASKYHCKDCGCQMHNCKPECDCSHDSHDEKGSWWTDADGNGVADAFESVEEAKAKPQQNLMAKTKALSKITKALTKKK
jgi:hypothetical protein